MSSKTILVSLCVIKIEIDEEESSETSTGKLKKKTPQY